jgi:hypothetical protein
MRMFIALLLFTCLIGLVACDQESGVKEEKTITTPEGQTTVTGETKVEKEGDHAQPDCGDPKCPAGCPCGPDCPCKSGPSGPPPATGPQPSTGPQPAPTPDNPPPADQPTGPTDSSPPDAGQESTALDMRRAA